uniref:Ribonuclease H-like domain-containing protein n=1 Tax=Tanacetum cinerariifolium TaxID=118510 RepID=A0A6L2JDG2_TANCI|nr:ribonuclease H-like domain-containing protein [Tanacetum cinerariifolium]
MFREEPAPQMAPAESSQMVSSVKLLILKKGEYTLWSMRMEQYLKNTDYGLWQVIRNGVELVQTTRDENGVETEIDHDDLEEIDLKWQVAMLSMRVKCFYKKTGMKLNLYSKELIAQEELTEFALMAYTLGSDTKEKEDLKAKLEQFEISSKNLNKLINSQLSAKDKTSLGYGDQLSDSDSDSDSEVLFSVFDSRSSDGDDNTTNDMFKKGDGYHAVPPPLTGNYLPPLADLSFAGLDDSVYKLTTNKASASISKGEPSVIKTSNISVEMPKVDSVRTSRVLIKDWVSVDEDTLVDTQETVNNVRINGVNTAGQISVSSVEGNRVIAFKTLAVCVWRPKISDLNNVSKDSSRSWISKRVKLIDPQGRLNGCFMHMAGKKSLLTDYADLLTKSFDVGDEAVHKKLGDRMEMAATIASSLEAEQDSEDEDAKDLSKQRRSLIEELDMDVDISLVPLHAADQGRKLDDTQVSGQPEDQLGVFSAAKVTDKGKAVMQESESTKKIKKRIQVQLSIDEELARKLHEEELARFNVEQESIDIARKEKVVAEGDQAHDIDWSDPAVIRYLILLIRGPLKIIYK